MRVLMVLKRFNPEALFGGAEISAYRLARALIAEGVDIEIVGARIEGGWKSGELLGVGDRYIRVTRLAHPRLRFVGTLVFNFLLLVKIFGGRKSYDLVHIHFASYEMMTAAAVRCLGGPPVICKVACSGEAGEMAIVHKRFYSFIFHFLLKKVDIFAALSPAIREELIGAGVSRGRIRLLNNGVDPIWFSPPSSAERITSRESLGIPEGVTVILFTGRLSRQKGLDVLLHSMARLRHLSLVLLVAGKGPERSNLESLSGKLGLEVMVRFLGPVDDVRNLYDASDIFVLASREEGLSNSLLEAMSSGLKIIATGVSGSSEAIEDGRSGILVTPGDVESLASALEKAVNGCERMGARARQRALEQYAIQTVAEKYMNVYAQLAGEKGTGEGVTSGVIKEGSVLKILTLINSYPPKLGGAERLVESLAGEFSRNGHSSLIITRWEMNMPLVEKLPGITIYRVPVFGMRTLRSLWFRASLAILLLVLRNRYDCIHAHSLDSPADVAVTINPLLNKRVFVTVHNIGKVEALMKRFQGACRLKRIIYGSSAIIAINRQIVKELADSGCPPGKIVFLTNGVDTDFYSPIDDRDKRRALLHMGVMDRTVYLFVGNFHVQKGIDTLLEAWSIFRRMNKAHASLLLLAGDGVLMNDALELTRKLDITDSVRFLGKRSDVHQYLKLADIYVQPSRWEGLSIALLEALSCAKAVITTPVGGNVEVIEDGVNGLLTPVDDAVALAGKMEYLLYNGERRRSLGEAGRETVIKRYSINKCALMHLRLFSGDGIGEEEEIGNGENEESCSAALERNQPSSGKEAETFSRVIS